MALMVLVGMAACAGLVGAAAVVASGGGSGGEAPQGRSEPGYGRPPTGVSTSAATPSGPGGLSPPAVDALPSAAHNTMAPSAARRKPPESAGTGPSPSAASPPSGVALRVDASGKCLTDRQEGLVVATCDASALQRWVLTEGTLRSGGLCATVPAGEVPDRTAVVMSECSGTAGQRFRLSQDAVVAADSGKCLDLFGGAAGRDVVLIDCNGRDNQRWYTS